jgi:hypothetical protein
MRRVLAIVAGVGSAFFVFYTIRLLVVTRFLTHLRPGGGGARLGAVVFPLLAVSLAVVAARLRRAPRGHHAAAVQ